MIPSPDTAGAPRLSIGLLQCGPLSAPLAERHGDYPDLYGALLGPGFDWTTYRVFEDALPAQPTDHDAWLVSGSRFGAYEDHAWIPPLEALLRAIHGTRPLVGICFGHQIIAQALGGRVEKFEGGWSVGRRSYDWEGREVHLNAWHQDQVVRPPEGARTVMRNDFTRHAGLLLGSTLTMQPHPEFPAPFIADMIPLTGRGTVPEPLLEAAAAALPEPVDNADVGARLAAFIREHAP